MKIKKGSIMDIFVFIVVAFVAVLFFAIWIYGFDILTDTLTGIQGTESVNISEHASNSFGIINPAQTSGLHIISFALIFAMALSILISSFLVRSHPVFFVVYIMIVIAGIVVAVPIRNSYEDLMIDSTLGTTISTFKGSSFIILNLPTWVTVIGVFGAILLFSGIMIDRQLGGTIQ